MFQREWYRVSGEGKLSDVDMGTTYYLLLATCYLLLTTYYLLLTTY